MPTFEIPIMIRALTKPETTKVLKRVANVIFDKGGYIRKIDNLGVRSPAYKVSYHNVRQKNVHHFIFTCDLPPRNLEDILDSYRRDMDVLNARIFKQADPNAPSPPCTFHEEMLPVPYRPDVQKLMDIAKKTKVGRTRIFSPNSGLDYYPFQR